MDHRKKGGGIVYLTCQTLWNQVYVITCNTSFHHHPCRELVRNIDTEVNIDRQEE
jgi:3'-phosphoadenosine 5'-phosphosulfate sulfotransferase (PAPS reductase)/FAD synthetase